MSGLSCPKTLLLALCLAGCLLTSAAYAEVIELEGTVKSVDASARMISVERKTAKGSKTLELEVNKKAGDLGALKVGDEIAFSYDPDLEIVTKITRDGDAVSAESGDSSPQRREHGARERMICREVCKRLENDHYLQPKIDADLASQTLDRYLRSLDPMKSYFLQSDIESFKEILPDLPSQLRDGDVSLAYRILDRFLERVDALLPQIEKEIMREHDFTKAESLVVNRDAIKWANQEQEALDNWRKRIKYDFLTLKMQEITGKAAREQLLRRYRSFAARMHNMSSDELMEMFLSALLTSVDGQSVYLSPETFRNFEIGMRMQLDGIGASLKGEDGYTTVTELVPGGAAAKDGRLKTGDRIIGIGQGESGDFEDVESMKLNDVVNLIRGKRGTVVRLKVLPKGQAVPKVYDITREKIELKNAEVRGEVLETSRNGGAAVRKIGVIRIPSFYADTQAMKKGNKDSKSSARDCKALLDGFRLQNVDAVVLDVRNNGGGSLPEVISVVGLFIDRGRVVQLKKRDGTVEPFDDKDSGGAWAGPVVVLVNSMTGGGAEIVPGAIQDHVRGLVVGDESTAGKAGILSLISLDDAEPIGSIKLLVQGLYRPGGQGFQQRGVRSDIVLPSVTGQLKENQVQENGGVAFDKIPSAGFQPVGRANEGKMRKLQKQSEARVAASKDFQKVVKALGVLNEQQAGTEVSLNEADFTKWWKANLISQDEATETGGKSRNAITRDYYLDEVLNIAADFADEVNAK